MNLLNLRNCVAFDLPGPSTGIAETIAATRTPVPPRKPIAFITNHGDMFCAGCKDPDRYDDGHDWLRVYETGGRIDECDECEQPIGGTS